MLMLPVGVLAQGRPGSNQGPSNPSPTGGQAQSGGATQGRSGSNPDGGGVDKPFAADGQSARTQGTSDFHGNNGWGKDDKRADDNNGNCGGLRGSRDQGNNAHDADGAESARDIDSPGCA